MDTSLGPCLDRLASWLVQKTDLPWTVALAVAALVVCVLPLLGVLVPMGGLATIAERKLAAAMQCRLGPNDTRADGLVALVVGVLGWWLPTSAQGRLVTGILRLP